MSDGITFIVEAREARSLCEREKWRAKIAAAMTALPAAVIAASVKDMKQFGVRGNVGEIAEAEQRRRENKP